MATVSLNGKLKGDWEPPSQETIRISIREIDCKHSIQAGQYNRGHAGPKRNNANSIYGN